MHFGIFYHWLIYWCTVYCYSCFVFHYIICTASYYLLILHDFRLCVFQSLCLINKSTVTSPVETFPSMKFTGYFKSNLSFGSVSGWIVPSFSLDSLCSPFQCPFGSVRLPPSLGLFHLIRLQIVLCLELPLLFHHDKDFFFLYSLHFDWYHC